MHRENESRGTDEDDRLDAVDRVVGWRCVHRRRRVRAGDDDDRVAIRRRAGDELRTRCPARTWPVIHDERLTERLSERRGDATRQNVGAAARRERNDEAYRLRRILLRIRVWQRHQAQD